MGVKSRGRGAAATFGLLLILAGVVGAIVLGAMSVRRPTQAIDGFARGPVGCTTTLEFSDTGTFYVYEELIGTEADVFAQCAPVPDPAAAFGFELLDDGRAIATRDDTSVGYDTDVAVGTSVARVEITAPGRYDLVVRGSDAAVVAAIGRDPDDGVDDLQRGALAVGVVGIVLGGLLLLLAGRRSKKAAVVTTPTGPGWGPQQRPVGPTAAWPPDVPTVTQVPVNPMLPPEPVQFAPPTADEAPPVPDEPVADAPPPPAAPADEPVSSEVPTAGVAAPPASAPTPASPWAPPTSTERKDPPPPPA